MQLSSAFGVHAICKNINHHRQAGSFDIPTQQSDTDVPVSGNSSPHPLGLCPQIHGRPGAVLARTRRAALADLKRLAAQVVAVELDQVESVKEDAAVSPYITNERLDGLLAHRINGQPMLYAPFIQSQPLKIAILRPAVRFDDCDKDQYEPFSGPPRSKTARVALHARNELRSGGRRARTTVFCAAGANRSIEPLINGRPTSILRRDFGT